MADGLALSRADYTSEPPGTDAAGDAGRFLPQVLSLAATWFGALAEGEAAAVRHLLWLRFVLVNMIAFALLGAVALEGWLGAVLAGDGTGLVVVIFGLFAYGLLRCARLVWRTSVELNELRGGSGERIRAHLALLEGRDGQALALAAAALKLKLSARIAPVRQIAGSLVVLGLIGTVLGFIIALSGIEPEAAADVSAIGPMVSTLIAGMSVALYTTLVGAVLNVWLMIAYRLLERGTISLLGGLVTREGGHGPA